MVTAYDMSPFMVGDRLRTRYSYWHDGIYVGPRGPQGESVVHNDYYSKKVVLTTPDEFVAKAGRPIYLIKRVPLERREEVAARALALLGTPFYLGRFNCQHFASFVQDGVAYSPRIQAAAISLGTAALIGACLLTLVAWRKA